MEPKEVKTALKFYESGYYKASVVFGTIGILAVVVLAALVVTDPLKLYGSGTHTDTNKVYGHPLMDMLYIYGLVVLLSIVVLGIVLSSRRAMCKVAAALAIKKTLGLDEEKE